MGAPGPGCFRGKAPPPEPSLQLGASSAGYIVSRRTRLSSFERPNMRNISFDPWTPLKYRAPSAAAGASSCLDVEGLPRRSGRAGPNDENRRASAAPAGALASPRRRQLRTHDRAPPGKDGEYNGQRIFCRRRRPDRCMTAPLTPRTCLPAHERMELGLFETKHHGPRVHRPTSAIPNTFHNPRSTCSSPRSRF